MSVWEMFFMGVVSFFTILAISGWLIIRAMNKRPEDDLRD
jgi:hypothetical protein